MYKEFANNLIEKLEEYKYTNLVDRGNGLEHCEKIGITECEGRDCLLCVWDEAEEIVRQFAEEYSMIYTAGSSPLGNCKSEPFGEIDGKSIHVVRDGYGRIVVSDELMRELITRIGGSCPEEV